MLVPQRVNPVISPFSFPKKNKGYEKMAPCRGCTQMPNFKSQCTMKLGAIGRLPWGVGGVFRLPPLKDAVASKEFPGKKWCKG